MIIGLIADAHIGLKNNSDVMLRHSLIVFDEIIESCISRNVNTVIHAGDFWNDRQSINSRSLAVGQQIIEKFEKHGINLYLIAGNHDFYYKTSKSITSINVFKPYKHVELIIKPTTLKLGDCEFILVPWLCNEDEIFSFSSYAETEGSDKICIGHFEIKKFFDNNFHQSYTGIEPEVLRHFKKVYSGHFHKRQTNGNISYLGSVFQKDHGEENQEKGITFLNTEDMSEQFHEFNNIPKHYTIKCTPELLKQPSKYIDKNYRQIVKGNFIRLNVVGFSNDNLIAKVEIELMKLGALDIRRNLCIIDEEGDISDSDGTRIDKDLIELGNPIKMHMDYISRPEFISKYNQYYDIKPKVMNKILDDLYNELVGSET